MPQINIHLLFSAEGENSLSTSGGPQEKIALISLAIIVTGMVIQGFGKGPRLSFAVTYVDNNTKKINTGFYSGVLTGKQRHLQKVQEATSRQEIS